MTKEQLYVYKVWKIRYNPGAITNKDLGGQLKEGTGEGGNWEPTVLPSKAWQTGFCRLVHVLFG